MRTSIPLTTFEGAPLAVLAVDAKARLGFLNAGAAALLSRSPRAVLDKPCWVTIGLRTVGGIPFCRPDCPLLRKARGGDPPSVLRLRLDTGREHHVDVDVTTLPIPPHPDGPVLLHLIEPVGNDGPWRDPDPGGGRASPCSALDRLTPREQEILRLMVEGRATREIASRLGISLCTVRNHVQSTLFKLSVHRRIEAVLAWIQNGS